MFKDQSKTPSLELQLIIAILSNDNNKTLHLISHSNLNWQLFYKLIIQHRVWYQVAFTFRDLDKQNINYNLNSSKQAIIDKIYTICERDKFKVLQHASETVRVSNAFTETNILHVVLKGITLNTSVYNQLISRPCKDIDIWISFNDLLPAIKMLNDLGYQQRFPSANLSTFKGRYHLNHRHDIEFFHSQKKVAVELHIKLDYHGTINFYPLTDKLIQTQEILDKKVCVLTTELNLLYLMIHGAVHGYTRLRWLYDIALYFTHYSSIDIKKLYSYAKELNVTYIVDETLMLLKGVLNVDNSTISQYFTKYHLNNKGTHLANMSRHLIYSHYQADGASNIFSKQFLIFHIYLFKLAVKGNKIHALCTDLFKLDLMFDSVTLPDKLAFLYYVIYPFWITKKVATSIFKAKPRLS